MEIKATLKRPYIEEQRLEFIAEQNHNNGYEIRETETELQAWGYTEEEKAEQEREFVRHLKCTKRVFALFLKRLGITYQQLKDLIATNDDAQLEWDLCVELSRDNPLLDQMCGQLGITPEQIDYIFKYANGLINQEENGNV